MQKVDKLSASAPFLLAWVLLSVAMVPLSSETALAETIALEKSSWQPITFSKIPETEYTFENGMIEARVKQSASALVLPFPKVRSLRSLSLTWKADGAPAVKDAEHEASKKGDDAPLRIGLMLSGPAPTIPFFASAWIKAVAKTLKHPSDKMQYLFIQAKHAPGQKWESPYSSSIENIALPSLGPDKEGWSVASFSSPEELKIVGLWLMADGDDTKSSFKVQIKNLELKE